MGVIRRVDSAYLCVIDHAIVPHLRAGRRESSEDVCALLSNASFDREPNTLPSQMTHTFNVRCSYSHTLCNWRCKTRHKGNQLARSYSKVVVSRDRCSYSVRKRYHNSRNCNYNSCPLRSLLIGQHLQLLVQQSII